MFRKRTLIIGLSCSLLAGPILYEGLECLCIYNVLSVPFEKTLWVKHPYDWHRLRMLKNLVQHCKLIGMTRGEIINLLGQDYATDWAKGGVYDENSMNYTLGFGPFNSEDPWWLCLKLERNRVCEYTVWEQDGVWSFRNQTLWFSRYISPELLP